MLDAAAFVCSVQEQPSTSTSTRRSDQAMSVQEEDTDGNLKLVSVIPWVRIPHNQSVADRLEIRLAAFPVRGGLKRSQMSRWAAG